MTRSMIIQFSVFLRRKVLQTIQVRWELFLVVPEMANRWLQIKLREFAQLWSGHLRLLFLHVNITMQM